MNCDVCGEDLRDEDGVAVIGINISLLGANPARKRVEEIYGKNQFNICHCCRLKSLGVKKVKTG